MAEVTRPTIAQLQAWYEADLARARQLEITVEFAACQGSLTVAVMHAQRAQGNVGRVEIWQEGGVWQAFSGARGFGPILNPELLPGALAFASCSGWLVQPVSRPWWRRLLDGPRWLVEVPLDTPPPTHHFPEIAPAIRARVLRSA